MYNGLGGAPTSNNARMGGFAPSTSPITRSSITSNNSNSFESGRSRARNMDQRHNVSRDRSLSTHRGPKQSESLWNQQYEMEEDDYITSVDDAGYDASSMWHQPPVSGKPLSSAFPCHHPQNSPVASRNTQSYYDPHANSYAAYAAVDPFFAAQLSTMQQQQQQTSFFGQQAQQTVTTGQVGSFRYP
jgi:hypothetical protein